MIISAIGKIVNKNFAAIPGWGPGLSPLSKANKLNNRMNPPFKKLRKAVHEAQRVADYALTVHLVALINPHSIMPRLHQVHRRDHPREAEPD